MRAVHNLMRLYDRKYLDLLGCLRRHWSREPSAGQGITRGPRDVGWRSLANEGYIRIFYIKYIYIFGFYNMAADVPYG